MAVTGPGDFAKRLQAAREATGWGKHEAARRAGILPPCYFRLEQGGRANPSYETVRRLVAGGLGLEWFFPAAAVLAAAQRIAAAAANEKGSPSR